LTNETSVTQEFSSRSRFSRS